MSKISDYESKDNFMVGSAYPSGVNSSLDSGSDSDNEIDRLSWGEQTPMPRVFDVPADVLRTQHKLHASFQQNSKQAIDERAVDTPSISVAVPIVSHELQKVLNEKPFSVALIDQLCGAILLESRLPEYVLVYGRAMDTLLTKKLTDGSSVTVSSQCKILTGAEALKAMLVYDLQEEANPFKAPFSTKTFLPPLLRLRRSFLTENSPGSSATLKVCVFFNPRTGKWKGFAEVPYLRALLRETKKRLPSTASVNALYREASNYNTSLYFVEEATDTRMGKAREQAVGAGVDVATKRIMFAAAGAAADRFWRKRVRLYTNLVNENTKAEIKDALSVIPSEFNSHIAASYKEQYSRDARLLGWVDHLRAMYYHLKPSFWPAVHSPLLRVFSELSMDAQQSLLLRSAAAPTLTKPQYTTASPTSPHYDQFTSKLPLDGSSTSSPGGTFQNHEAELYRGNAWNNARRRYQSARKSKNSPSRRYPYTPPHLPASAEMPRIYDSNPVPALLDLDTKPMQRQQRPAEKITFEDLMRAQENISELQNAFFNQLVKLNELELPIIGLPLLDSLNDARGSPTATALAYAHSTLEEMKFPETRAALDKARAQYFTALYEYARSIHALVNQKDRELALAHLFKCLSEGPGVFFQNAWQHAFVVNCFMRLLWALRDDNQPNALHTQAHVSWKSTFQKLTNHCSLVTPVNPASEYDSALNQVFYGLVQGDDPMSIRSKLAEEYLRTHHSQFSLNPMSIAQFKKLGLLPNGLDPVLIAGFPLALLGRSTQDAMKEILGNVPYSCSYETSVGVEFTNVYTHILDARELMQFFQNNGNLKNEKLEMKLLVKNSRK